MAGHLSKEMAERIMGHSSLKGEELEMVNFCFDLIMSDMTRSRIACVWYTSLLLLQNRMEMDGKAG